MDIHAEAELFVLPESDGGRKSPFFSGYRPCIAFDDVYNGLTINLLDAESLGGGDTGRVSLSFTYLPAFVGRIRVGMPFDIAEGARCRTWDDHLRNGRFPVGIDGFRLTTCMRCRMERLLAVQRSCNMVFTLGPSAHLGSLATGHGLGTISVVQASLASFRAVS